MYTHLCLDHSSIKSDFVFCYLYVLFEYFLFDSFFFYKNFNSFHSFSHFKHKINVRFVWHSFLFNDGLEELYATTNIGE